MSLRIILQPDQIQRWLTDRQGTPFRQRGTETELRVRFGNETSTDEKLSVDELIETMKFHHLVLLVDDAAGQTFHKFVGRG